MNEVMDMDKNDVLIVGQSMSGAMERQLYSSSVSNAHSVRVPLFGKLDIIGSIAAGIGSGFGSPRVALSGGYASFLAIALQHLTGLKTTGLVKCPRNKMTMLGSDI